MSNTNINGKTKFLGEPCRNFCIMGDILIHDPKDNKEKVVLSSIVHGGIGVIIIIDPMTGAGESIEMPGDDGAWALFNLNNDKLLVGTCGTYGYLHSLDLRTRIWDKSLKDPNEQYIWNLAMGSDGMIYGGTWPGCVLLKYDPTKHTLENLGRASDNIKNMYTRLVYGGVPGYMLISIGCEESHVATYSIDNGTFGRLGKSGAAVKEITSEFICLSYAKDNTVEFYNPNTFELMDTAAYLPKMKVRDSRLKPGMGWELVLEDGRLAGVRGQEFFIFENGDASPKLMPIPVEAPATGIMTILPGPDNKIWGATTLGQTIFWYNPENGEYYNSQVVCDIGGEVYGMKFVGNKLYLSAYSGGDHVVYDITKPWNQIDNINPKTLETVRPKMIRPTGRTIQGPDGNIWTGWGAQYGVYGGGLSKIDVATEKMDYYYDPIEGWSQTIGNVESDEKYIYFTTNGGASGLATKTEPFHLAAFDPFEGKVVKTIKYDSGVKVGCLTVIDGFVAVAIDKQINIYKCESMEYAGSINVDSECTCFVRYDDKRFVAFCNGKAYFVNPEKLEAEYISDFEGKARSAAVLNGRVYFTVEIKLFELVF